METTDPVRICEVVAVNSTVIAATLMSQLFYNNNELHSATSHLFTTIQCDTKRSKNVKNYWGMSSPWWLTLVDTTWGCFTVGVSRSTSCISDSETSNQIKMKNLNLKKAPMCGQLITCNVIAKCVFTWTYFTLFFCCSGIVMKWLVQP